MSPTHFTSRAALERQIDAARQLRAETLWAMVFSAGAVIRLAAVHVLQSILRAVGGGSVLSRQ